MDNRVSMDRNRRRKESTRFKGKYVKHSDIVRNRVDKNISPVFVAGKTEPADGGSSVTLEENTAFRLSAFFMAEHSSTGSKKIVSGNKTYILNVGVAYIQVSGKSFVKKDMLRPGERLSVHKGHTFEIGSGNYALEFLEIESMDFKCKNMTDAISSADGAAQYINARKDIVGNFGPRSDRKVKTEEERQEFGDKVKQAQGIIPVREKESLRKAAIHGGKVVTGNPLAGKQAKSHAVGEQPAVIEGVNPKPLGDKA